MIKPTLLRLGRNIFPGLLLVSLIVTACGRLGLPPDEQPPLSDTQWMLVQMNEQEALEGAEPTLIFDDINVGGNTGCNHYGGEYTTGPDGALEFSELIQTEIACSEPEGVMAQEADYMDRLRLAASYQVIDDSLEILNQAGETTLIFERINDE